MRTPALHRRGKCLFQVVLALAVLGLLALVFGALSVWGAMNDAQSKFQAVLASATPIAAPGSKPVELGKGSAIVFLVPDGEIDGKKYGALKSDATVTVTAKDPSGETVKVEAFDRRQWTGAPMEPIGVIAVEKAGTFTIDIQTSDGAGAAIFVAAATEDEANSVRQLMIVGFQGIAGACTALCGCAFLVTFGALGLFLKFRRKEPDPLEHV
ncbi:MAG: hypothetical protein ACKOYN_12265 [Planctomycetota bacterium]